MWLLQIWSAATITTPIVCWRDDKDRSTTYALYEEVIRPTEAVRLGIWLFWDEARICSHFQLVPSTRLVRENVAQGIKRFFITDDNFARNRQSTI
jgi:hypothetical protein